LPNLGIIYFSIKIKLLFSHFYEKMAIITSHTHRLRFTIDQDASKEYIQRWMSLKKICENSESDDKKQLVIDIINHCKLSSNQKLQYLQRVEGGFYFINTNGSKEIRFIINNNIRSDEIYLSYVNFTGSERWTYEEFDDLIFAFATVANNLLQAQCVTGLIELSNFI